MFYMFSVFLLFILLSFMLYYLIVCSYQSYKEEFNMNERLKQQLDFILEIDKEKNILRQTHLSGHGRRENDAEHAWHMAIMAYLLKDYANEPVDIAKVMIMCLIHDIVEIDAGDTYAYDTEGLKTQKAREDAAKERIFSLLPEDQKKELEELLTQLEPFLSLDFDISRFLQFRYMTIRLLPNRYTEDNGKRSWDLRLYIK